jgi:hypothetical protein
MTGQDVPGGASMMVNLFGSVQSRTFRIKGGDMASPTLNLP